MHLNEIIKQKPNEVIVAVVRRHPLTYVPSVLLYVVIGLIPIVLYFFIKQFSPDILANNYIGAIIILIFSAFELSVALFFYSSFLVYYLDMIIITNDRFVEVSQRNLFSRSVSEFNLYKIQDVTSEIVGVIPTLFNYGNITVETAGEGENLTFHAIGSPHELRRQIVQLADENRKMNHEELSEVNEAHV